jgi:hypothetical protein
MRGAVSFLRQENPIVATTIVTIQQQQQQQQPSILE